MRVWALASCGTLAALAACTANQPVSQELPKDNPSPEGKDSILDQKAAHSQPQPQRQAVSRPETTQPNNRSRPQPSSQAQALLQQRLEQLRAKRNGSLPQLQAGPSFSRASTVPNLPQPAAATRVTSPSLVQRSQPLARPAPAAPAAPASRPASQPASAPAAQTQPTRPQTLTPPSYAVVPVTPAAQGTSQISLPQSQPLQPATPARPAGLSAGPAVAPAELTAPAIAQAAPHQSAVLAARPNGLPPLSETTATGPLQPGGHITSLAAPTLSRQSDTAPVASAAETAPSLSVSAAATPERATPSFSTASRPQTQTLGPASVTPGVPGPSAPTALTPATRQALLASLGHQSPTLPGSLPLAPGGAASSTANLLPDQTCAPLPVAPLGDRAPLTPSAEDAPVIEPNSKTLNKAEVCATTGRQISQRNPAANATDGLRLPSGQASQGAASGQSINPAGSAAQP